MRTERENLTPLVEQLYGIVQQLESLFPGRPFTLDGHLVGSLGEVLAAQHYSLALLPPSAERHDAKASDGRLVQVKATQVNRVSLSSCPDHLLVLRVARDGTFHEVYNGPGKLAWDATGKLQKNGQRSVGLAKLAKLMSEVPLAQRLVRSMIGEVSVGAS